MCHNYALASGPPWLKPLPRLLSHFCCSWAPNDDVTAILPVVFSYHTLESLYVICHFTVVFSYHTLESLYVICHVTVVFSYHTLESLYVISWLKVVCMVLELAFELSTRWDVILRMLSA